MKNVILLFAFSCVLFSCNKDRVEDPSSDFESMDSYRNANLEQEQDFTITNDNGGPIVGRKGTTIYANRLDFETLVPQDVDLPYNVHLYELYSIKDFIINTKATIAGSNVINTAGMVKVTATKDNGQLRLKSGKLLRVDLNTAITDTDLSVYQGTFPDYSFTTWNLSSDGSSVSDTLGKYALSLATLGWNTAGKVKSSSFVNVTFAIENATGTEFIELYAKPLNYKGLIKGGNLLISGVPKGESVQLLALAKDSDGNYRVFNQTLTLDSDITIALEMGEYNESGFTSFLNSL